MMRITRISAARTWASGVLAVILLAANAARAEGGDAERGHELVQRNCAMCHAIGPTGQSPNTAAPVFRDLHRNYPIENLAEALAEGILTGHPQMPEFVFGAGDVEDIIRYLESVQTRRGAKGDRVRPGPRGA